MGRKSVRPDEKSYEQLVYEQDRKTGKHQLELEMIAELGRKHREMTWHEVVVRAYSNAFRLSCKIRFCLDPRRNQLKFFSKKPELHLSLIHI